MTAMRPPISRAILVQCVLAGVWLGACAPESSPADTGTGGTTAAGAAGSTGAGGATVTGDAAGRGGATGAAGRGGATGAAGRGGATGAGGGSGSAPVAYTVCLPCHGSDGKGVAGHGPDIQHPVVDFSTWVIRNGRTHPDFPDAMPQFTTASLSDADLQSILAFLAAFPKPTTGMGLFVDFCANCHGADAAGGVTMRPIATEPMTAFMTNVRNGHSAGMFSNRREFMPKWTATQITDAEIRSIYTYVSGL